MFGEGAEETKYKILIVEDNLFNQMVLRKIPKSRYMIVASTIAEDTLAGVHIFELHLILLDTILPDTSGFDVPVTLK